MNRYLNNKHTLFYSLTIGFFIVMCSFFTFRDASIYPIQFSNISTLKYVAYSVVFIGLVFEIFVNQNIYRTIDYLVLIISLLIIIGYVLFQYVMERVDLNLIFKLISLIPLIFLMKQDFKSINLDILALSIVALVMIYYSLHIPKYFGNRFVSNSDDPNFTGLYCLFVFLYSKKRNYKFFIIFFLILGFLTLSRNFIFSVILFYAISYLKKYNFFKSIFKFLRFHILMIILNIIMLSLTYVYVYSNSYKFIRSVDSSSRVLAVNDESNFLRFYDIFYALDRLSDEENLLLYGAGNNFWENMKIKAPHNALISLLTVDGAIFTALFFFIISLIINKFNHYDNYEYIFSVCFFSIFLSGLFATYFIYCFVLILSLKSKK